MMPASIRPIMKIAALALLVGGCGYTTRGLYREDIRTVAVPIFVNNGLRRDIEFELTQKVIQYIESRTPYKVVSRENADATIQGQIASFFKNSSGEDGFDNPRGGVLHAVVQITWIDNRTGAVIGGNSETVNLSGWSIYNIDTAQSNATATTDLVEQLADKVIVLLHAPW